jgi:hypothetical protein
MGPDLGRNSFFELVQFWIAGLCRLPLFLPLAEELGNLVFAHTVRHEPDESPVPFPASVAINVR